MANDTEGRLSIRMDKEELEKLKKYAETKNMSFTEWVRQSLLFQAGVQDDRIAQLERRLAVVEAKVA